MKKLIKKWAHKIIGKEYNIEKIVPLIKNGKEIEFFINFALFQLLEEIHYLESAYSQVQSKADNLKPDVRKKFLNYPIPKAILEANKKRK